MKYCTHCFNKRLMLTTDCGQSVPSLLLLLVVALCGWCRDIVQMGRHWVARVAGRPSSIMAATGAESRGYWEDVVLIRHELNGGAWCPRNQIEEDVYEYLQIDLGRLMVITKVETQGRFGNGQCGPSGDQQEISIASSIPFPSIDM
ncbi:hypothetical protein RRG08_018969 [Elysia crispata]|uniref:F5/8 type C domain-containing protein n=1 Tax=Elysia crispata TaxID=231223 RepID=A0AAE1A4W3_9GAST|nr:hypothetical protein RRG08_018969 [Elysia crispata]